MKVKLLLRLASGLMLFHLIGHSLGHSGWNKSTDLVKQEVIRQMTEHKFPFMGAERSMGNYFEGYGWASSVALVFFSAVQWIASSAGEENKKLVGKLLVALGICLIAWSTLEFIYFFAFAGGITFLSAMLTLLAARRIKARQ